VGRRVRQVRIYVVRDAKAQPLDVQLGISDGSKTEVVAGDLKENDPVIIGIASGTASANQGGVVNPFQPARPRGVGIR
jgi:HlyD family secretion protein